MWRKIRNLLSAACPFRKHRLNISIPNFNFLFTSQLFETRIPEMLLFQKIVRRVCLSKQNWLTIFTVSEFENNWFFSLTKTLFLHVDRKSKNDTSDSMLKTIFQHLFGSHDNYVARGEWKNNVALATRPPTREGDMFLKGKNTRIPRSASTKRRIFRRQRDKCLALSAQVELTRAAASGRTDADTRKHTQSYIPRGHTQRTKAARKGLALSSSGCEPRGRSGGAVNRLLSNASD